VKILTIRQPWASLIIHGGKDIENRTWATRYRGPLLIQASAARDVREFTEARWRGITIPDELLYGGVIGIVDLLDCVPSHASPWFTGPFGFVLAHPRALPFIPLRGRLGLFDAPKDLFRQLNLTERKIRQPALPIFG